MDILTGESVTNLLCSHLLIRHLWLAFDFMGTKYSIDYTHLNAYYCQYKSTVKLVVRTV